MRTEIKLVTPKMAKEYLLRNNGNRKVNDRLINYFADQMKRGLWKLTGQGISIDYDGNLIDGQHRLKAVISAGIPVKFLIVFDIERDTFKVYDSGKMRSASDSFKIEGIPNASTTASSIYKYLILKRGFKSFSTGRTSVLITVNDQLNEYNIDPEFWDDMTKYSLRLYAKYRLYPTTAVVATIAYLVKEKKHPLEKINLFFDELYGLANSRPSITLLRDKIIKDALSSRSYSSKDKFIFLKKCWNSYITGRNLSLYKNKPDEKEFDFL